MLARKFRLQKREVEKLYKKGRTLRFKDFLIRVNPNRTNHARFAIIISKKTLARAVDRNHARRQTYEAIRQAKALWQGQPLDLSISFRKFDLAELDKALTQVFKG